MLKRLTWILSQIWGVLWTVVGVLLVCTILVAGTLAVTASLVIGSLSHFVQSIIRAVIPSTDRQRYSRRLKAVSQNYSLEPLNEYGKHYQKEVDGEIVEKE